MNNNIPFFYPFNTIAQQNSINQNDIEKIKSKLDNIEKQLRTIEDKLSKIGNINSNNDNYSSENPTDMYII